MATLVSFFPGIVPAAQAFWWIFIHGGWLALIIIAVYILYKLYRWEIRGQFIADQDWAFLSVKVPRENLTSTLGVEQIFAQMHAMHVNLTPMEIYIEGKIQQWYSLELVSLGGKISFIIRTPRQLKDTVEAAFYSQYPNAEISEVSDYMENVEYHPGHSDFEIFGCEMKLLEKDVLPIKTYKDFEHPTAEVKIVDPLSTLFEALSKMEPHEFFGIQMTIQPLGDAEWKGKSEKVAKELIGEEVEHDRTILSTVGQVLSVLNPIKLLHTMLVGMNSKSEEKHEEKDVFQRNKWMGLTDVEKEKVNLIQKKASKPGYLTKIRLLYMAPKDKFDTTKKSIIIGAYRTMGDTNRNGLKPDTRETWTSPKYKISTTLEEPYVNWLMRRRKHHIFNGYKKRHLFIGRDPVILNTEELATLYHLPLTSSSTVPDVAKLESKKAQAPVNLPVGEY